MRRLLPTRWVMAAILGMGLFAMATRNAGDPDLWWHLRTGQLIVAHRAVFYSDPFSFTRFGQPWINHEWLSDVLIFSFFRYAGWAGLIAGFATIIAAIFYVAFMRSLAKPYVAAIFTVWAALASAPLCAARPQMFSLLLVSLFLLLLERSLSRPILLFWIPPLTLIWVNLHGGYIAGVALVCLYLAGDVLDWAFGFMQAAEALSHGKKLLLTLGVSLALVPLNPYGTRLYKYPFDTLRSAAMQKHIAEWFSPDFHQPQYLPILLMILVTLAVVALSPRRLRPREVMLLLASLFAGLVSLRHLPIFALLAAPLLSELTESWVKDRTSSKMAGTTPQPTSAKMAFNFLLLLFVAGFAATWLSAVVHRQSQVEAESFPAAAVSFLASQHLPRPIFNNYDWGGYLIWRLYPDYRVYIDGRADLYGDAFMDSFANSYTLHGAWEMPLENWEVRTIIVPPNAAVLAGLRLLPNWREAYRDSQAVIMTRAAGK